MGELSRGEREHSQETFFLLSPVDQGALSKGMSLYAFLGGTDLALRATVTLPLFFFKILALLSFVSVCGMRARRLANLYRGTGRTNVCTCNTNNSNARAVALPSMCSCRPVNNLVPLPGV